MSVAAAPLQEMLRVSHELADNYVSKKSEEAKERPGDVLLQEGATCLRFTPAQRQMMEEVLAQDESPAAFSRRAAMLLVLLRQEGIAERVKGVPMRPKPKPKRRPRRRL